MAAFVSPLPVLYYARTASQTTLSMSTSRPFRRNNRRQHPRRQPSEFPQSTSEPFQFFDEQDQPTFDPDELSEIDDGFFSRYMRDREREQEKEGEEERPRRRMDRDTAASAFDAVDKLFGSLKAKKGEERGQWLDDVRARAATLEDNKKGDALDVDAEDVEKNEFVEGEVDRSDEEDADIKPPSGEQPKEGKLDDSYTFDTLMKFARRGPSGDNRRRTPRPRRDARDTRDVRDVYDTRDANRDANRDATWERDQPSVRRDQQRSSDFSHLLGLTKRMADRRDGKDEDDYEPIDDEMEKTIEFRGSAKRKDARRRQRYTAVRRIGGQSRRILTPPVEWLPMSEEEIDKVKSDHRSLGGKARDGRLQGVVADCRSCRGTGLDTCIACLGAGWVLPLKDDDKIDEERRVILEEMWNRPNLVIDSEGEAQCVRCNGVGKQFCKTCKGSGSALKKGFSISERDEVFDMFVNVNGPEIGDGEEDEYDNEDEDEEEEDDDDVDSFQLYRGSGETFDFMRKKRDDGSNTNEDTDDDVGVDDVIEVEDESAELLAALEAMHLADIEERKTGKRTPGRRSSRIGRTDDDDDDEDNVNDAGDVDDVDVGDIDDVDDIGDDDDVDNDGDEEFAVGMNHNDSEDLQGIVEEDDDFADLVEEDISVDATLTGEEIEEEEEEEEENGDDVNEADYNDYD